MREVIFLLSISSFFHSSFFPQHSYASPLASTISSATCSPSALLLLPAVKNANLCIERTLQTQPLYTRALPGTSVAPILLPFPLLILSNHRRCVSSLFSSIGQLEFFWIYLVYFILPHLNENPHFVTPCLQRKITTDRKLPLTEVKGGGDGSHA